MPSASLDDREREIRRRLRDDFEHYASRCLKIRTKTGSTEPLTLNTSQRLIHERIEKQRRETGRVRALILKGRQMGVSTYIGGRIYWRTTHTRGARAFILTHTDDATNNLFGFAKRYHDHCPSLVRPEMGHSNAKELTFPRLDSSYKVGTAGNKNVGRSETLQMFHGSEVAFWPHADEHFAGIMQAIPNVEGTEALLESTANGLANVFGMQWKLAERGEANFEPIFVPWFLDEQYQTEPPCDWRPTPQWEEYGELHSLTPQRLYWAYVKNRELISKPGGGMGGDISEPSTKFKQEYPGTSNEAFEITGEGAFIPPIKVQRARKNKVEGHGPIILGVDPNRGGADKAGFVDRQGRRVGKYVCERMNFGDDTMKIVGHTMMLRHRLKPLGLKKIVVDITGVGAGVYDRLREQLPPGEVVGVNFGAGALNPRKYANRRAEMHDLKREWYNDPAGVQVPDTDEFQSDETAIIWGPSATHYRSNGQLILEPKDAMKVRLGYSPDISDAHGLTHAIDMRALYDHRDDRPAPNRGSGWAG